MTPSPSIDLATLFADIDFSLFDEDMHVTGLTLDSRQVKKGYVFFLTATGTSGESYAQSAIEKGCIAIVKETLGDSGVSYSGVDQVYWVAVKNVRQAMTFASEAFFDADYRCMDVVGVTGTNGKTSVVNMLAQCWRMLDKRAASVGTLGWSTDGVNYHAEGMTTRDVIENHKLIEQFSKTGVEKVALEVSSHGIAQERIQGIRFSTRVLTNISRDHLDYHKSMQEYIDTKLSFMDADLSIVIINWDCEKARLYLEEKSDAKNVLSFSLISSDANVYAKNIDCHAQGISAEVHSPWGILRVELPLLGEFNLANALVVIAVLGLESISISEIEDCLGRVSAIPGRMEKVGGLDVLDLNRQVFIDFAHTPDALEKILSAARAHFDGRLVLVFGCGGNRDSGKRAEMGAIAEKNADLVIVTSDNPRYESADKIIDDIMCGVTDKANFIVESDRAIAIKQALSLSVANDAIIIAGKGHEKYQEIDGVKKYFSDYEEVLKASGGISQ